MPQDVFYGRECEARYAIMPDAVTDPDDADWLNLEFVSLTVTPTRERIARPKVGRATNNVLDPTKPIPGFLKLAAELVLDADTLGFALVLQAALGAAASTGPAGGIYTHTWASGVKAPRYFALQLKFAGDVSATPVRVYRGLTFAALSLQGTGEQVQNFDLSMSLRGLSRDRVADWLGDAPPALPAEAPCSRALFLVDSVAATNTLQTSWSWDRQIAEDAFLSSTPTLSGIRPGGGAATGSAQFRAIGDVFDDMEEDDTVFAAEVRMLGVTASHEIRFQHLQAMLAAPAVAIPGPALIQRDIAWTGHQVTAAPAVRVVVKNNVAAYA